MINVFCGVSLAEMTKYIVMLNIS